MNRVEGEKEKSKEGNDHLCFSKYLYIVVQTRNDHLCIVLGKGGGCRIGEAAHVLRQLAGGHWPP